MSAIAMAASSPHASSCPSPSQFSEQRSASDHNQATSRLQPDHHLPSSPSHSTSSPAFLENYQECKDRSSSFRNDDQNFLQILEPSAGGWTDDKHSSYLNSVEANFVRNMYEREFCSVDVCGHAPECTDSSEMDCTESQLASFCDGAASCPAEFKAWRNGGWQSVACDRLPLESPAAVLRNPWIQHFRPNTSARSSARTSRRRSPLIKDHKVEKPLSLDYAGGEQKAKKGVRMWQERLKNQCSIAGQQTLRLKPSVMKALKRDARFLAEGKRIRTIQPLHQGLPIESAHISEIQKQEQESKFVSGPISCEMKSGMDNNPAVRSVKVVVTGGQCYDECPNTRQTIPFVGGMNMEERTGDSCERDL